MDGTIEPISFFSRKAEAVLGVQAGDTQAWLRLLNSDRAHWHPSGEKIGVLAVSVQNPNFYNTFSMSDWKKTRRRACCIDEAPRQERKKFEVIPSASYQPPPEEEFLGVTSFFLNQTKTSCEHRLRDTAPPQRAGKALCGFSVIIIKNLFHDEKSPKGFLFCWWPSLRALPQVAQPPNEVLGNSGHSYLRESWQKGFQGGTERCEQSTSGTNPARPSV